MHDQMTIPKTLKVGFQKRSDTYTGKLAYVVYIDAKGKLRKEGSWEGWRDKQIPVLDVPNEPTSGFVLNRDVGGTRRSYGWNARIEKVRVYDPRDFEFEISIPNLLFILQETSAIKGKGLEGEFVYAWSGPELILLPISSQEYKGSAEFTSLQTEKVSKKDMEVGCSYLMKNQAEVIYMGAHIWWGTQKSYSYPLDSVKIGAKRHIFAEIKADGRYDTDDAYILESGFTKVAKKTSTSPVPQYAEIYDAMMKSHLLSKPVRLEVAEYTPKDMSEKNVYGGWNVDRDICVEHDGKICAGSILASICNYEYPSNYSVFWNSGVHDDRRKKELEWAGKCDLKCDHFVEIKDGRFVRSAAKNVYWLKQVTRQEAIAAARTLDVVCENGSRYRILKGR